MEHPNPWPTGNHDLWNYTHLGSTNQRLWCTLCRGVDHSRRDCALAYLHSSCTRPPPRSPYLQNLICVPWNKGNCIVPGESSFRHVCATCQLLHKARDCPQTIDTSQYKQLHKHKAQPDRYETQMSTNTLAKYQATGTKAIRRFPKLRICCSHFENITVTSPQ